MKKITKNSVRVPLERALSKLGIASRTTARDLILDGKVKVDGSKKTNPDFLVNPERVKITIAGTVAEKKAPIYLLLHKPRGVVTTSSDEKGRKTVFDLLGDFPEHLIAVGRLDMATSGLLLLTNDTKFSAWLTDPRNKIPRTYLASVEGLLTEDEIKPLLVGIHDNNEILQASKIEIQKTSKKESHVLIVLHEGKNREIRRMFSAIGHEITRLKRIAFGKLTLGEIQPGQYHAIDINELEECFPNADLRK